jgi:hypothetical protein
MNDLLDDLSRSWIPWVNLKRNIFLVNIDKNIVDKIQVLILHDLVLKLGFSTPYA